MDDHVLIDCLQSTLTVTFHYLFPILTMGLALFIAHMKTVSYLGRPDRRLRLLRKTDEERERYEGMSRFWAKIFAVNFAFGVVTGIPMEFQFGTNWAAFSNYAGGVIGTTLAMEGMFAFFAESVFLGIFLLAARARERARVSSTLDGGPHPHHTGGLPEGQAWVAEPAPVRRGRHRRRPLGGEPARRREALGRGVRPSARNRSGGRHRYWTEKLIAHSVDR